MKKMPTGTVFALSVLFLFGMFFPSSFQAETPTIVDVQVNSSTDDAYHVPAGWPGYSHTDTAVYAGNISGRVIWGGWRWTNLNIPAGSTITNAYVELNQSGWGYNTVTTLAFENSPNPATFSSTSTPNNRWQNKTLFQTTWNWPKQAPGAWIRTSDLSQGIQELVNTHGALASLVLLEDGTGVPSGNYHSWASYNSNPSLAPKLHIEYTSGLDTAPPTRSNGQPTGVLPVGTTQTTLSLNTNENATCKYSTVAGLDYGVMTELFSVTGGLAHSTDITGLTNGTNYTYYARCQDAAGNANPEDYAISFSVAMPDLTPPVRSNGQPTGNLPSGTTQANLSITTDETATCKYDTVAETSYGLMPNTFAITGGTSHASTINGLTNNTSYAYYVRCQDAAANENPDDYFISFTVLPDTIPPVRSNGQPTGALPAGTTQTIVSVNTDENAVCKYDTIAGTSYNLMPNTFAATGGMPHSSTVNGLTDGTEYVLYVRCQDILENANTDDYSIAFSVNPPGPMIRNAQVSFSADDAYDVPTGWPNYNHTDTVVYAGNVSGRAVWGGWRWTGLNIPADATITNAYAELNQSGWGYIIPTTLAFENSANSASFSSSSTPATRWNTRTTFSIPWTWPKANAGSWIRTPDLSSGIQELIGRHGAINSIALLEDGSSALSSNYHTWASYDSNPAMAAKIYIEYTSGPDVMPPARSNGQPAGTLPAGTTQATLGVSTSENATCKYDIVPGVAYATMASAFATTGGFDHSTLLSGLTDGNAYAFYARCEDGSGNANADDYAISFSVAMPDAIPPQITNIAAFPASNSATISWATNEPATSQVGYGLADTLGSFTTLDSSLVTSHSVGITGLAANTAYYYRVYSNDANNNQAAEPSIPNTFTTLATPPPSGGLPPDWPTEVELAVGESYNYTLKDGTTRTLTLLGYSIIIPRHKVEATVQVSGNNKTEQHTLRVAFNALPVSINGLRVYGYVWKEANAYGFEQVGGQGPFPLSLGKDVGFAVNDASDPVFPNLENYRYPFDGALHENAQMQTFIEPNGGETAVAHAGFDVGAWSGKKIKAMMDGYVWHDVGSDPESQGMVRLTATSNENNNNQACWVWTHVRGGGALVPNGTFVTKGTPIVNEPWGNHYHMSACQSFDFGSMLLNSELWKNEHPNDFPAPRYWLSLGPFDGGMNINHIGSDEMGPVLDAVTPQKDGIAGGLVWKLADNFASSITRMAELQSAAPFSGYEYGGGQTSTQPEKVGYAAAYIYSPADHSTDNAVHLKWGVSNAGKVWLNGVSIFDGASARYNTYDIAAESPILIDAYDIPLALQQGWNTLIVKTDQGTRYGTAWLFSAKIGDVNGNRMPELLFSTRALKVQETEQGSNYVNIAWTDPAFHGAFVDTYLVDVATDAAFTNLVVSSGNAGKHTSYRIPGLSPNSTYYVRVVPRNASELGGTSYWQFADVIQVTTTANDAIAPARTPPGGLSPSQAPQFITLGSDDNNRIDGVNFFVNELFAGKVNPAGTENSATYDGTPVKGTFYLIGTHESYGAGLRDAHRNAYDNGHEIGNHGYCGLTSDAACGGGVPTTVQGWKDNWIVPAQGYLTRPLAGDGVLVQSPGGQTVPRLGLNIPTSEIYGYRAAEDAYNSEMYTALQELGFTYAASTATGYSSNGDNATTQYWPGTLENGFPTQGNLAPTGSHPGFWELPQDRMDVPAELRTKLGLGAQVGYCDKDWFAAGIEGTDIATLLKYNLDQHSNGNKAPMHLCLHSQEWGKPDWQPERSATTLARQAALQDFLTYALTKPEVRVIKQRDVINWIKNPIPLGTP
ncbi:MAG: fibronectin type III domain-containing protein [Candidatus Wildermuthbacteria bacterium]|nr:fibronectin type III domain-containing protein [Candidatus Wildermuthbacteria bacterium]